MDDDATPIAAGFHGRIKTRRLDADSRRR
jgi:hypothetical protein